MPTKTKDAAVTSGKKVIVIPDTQVKPGVSIEYLEWIGKYIAAKSPDTVVHLGDHWDFPSLSSYDRGKRAAENRRVARDIEAGNRGLEILTQAITSGKGSTPRLVLLRGNHEQRLERYTEDNPELDGSIGEHQFNDTKLGWEVVPFLKPITIYGVTFCHYFPRGPNGKITQTRNGAPSAAAQLTREMRSSIAGHQQGFDYAIRPIGGKLIRSIIAGSCYLHDESYLSPQGNAHWRGILCLNEVRNGNFALMEVTLEYLKRRYGGRK